MLTSLHFRLYSSLWGVYFRFLGFSHEFVSVVPACNCSFRELHVIKFPGISNKFVITDAARNDGGVFYSGCWEQLC